MSSAAALVGLKRVVPRVGMITTPDQWITFYGYYQSPLTTLYNTLRPTSARKLAGHRANGTTLEATYVAGLNAYNMASALSEDGAMEEEIYDQAFMKAGAPLTPITLGEAFKHDPECVKLAAAVKILIYSGSRYSRDLCCQFEFASLVGNLSDVKHSLCMYQVDETCENHG